MKIILWMTLAFVSVIPAAETTVQIDVEGMTCPLCTTAIKKSLKNTKGVIKTKVSLNKRMAKVVYDDSVANQEDLLKAVEATGYKGEIRGGK